MPLNIEDFSPYLENGLLDLNKVGNKFYDAEGHPICRTKYFENTFDIERLAEFIQNTPGVTALKASMCGLGEISIDNFQLLMDAINNSNITGLNFENNSLGTEMAQKISQLSKIINLNLSFCNIGDDGIITIVNSLANLVDINVEGNYITDTGANAIVNYLPNITSLNIAYGNNISCDKLKEIATAHSNTLTMFNIFSSAYSGQAILQVAELLPAGVVTLGSNYIIDLEHNVIVDAHPPLI
ncbi:hypothetical protein [Candidatus Tisiphia endosymbiont of Hybos culiciformis]|uniref:hypothetical protein n=1 Tax=Candidatus Tisiphia endosymbiont of Hybos culiciformis TaxID=3139331 RepID=UPI003CCB0E98